MIRKARIKANPKSGNRMLGPIRVSCPANANGRDGIQGKTPDAAE